MEELKNRIILKKYRIIKRIGKGSFGSVFLGKNIQQNDFVAIKIESKNQTDTILERETYILYSLKGFGIPEVITYGQNIKYNILIQELLGKSLDKIFFEKNRKFSTKDCCMIGIQVLDRLEYIHSKYIIHRDIKADNFLIGLKNKSIIYIIDFGLAKQYKSKKTGKHVKYVINKKWSGTSRFASANTLRGVEPSRRDDLESFCYLMLYLMKGSLPWDNINEETEINEILIIYKMKQYMTPEMLFRDLPVEMIKLFKYCKNLEFEQKPNYKYLRSLFISILTNIGEKNDLHFCWIINIVLNKSKNQLINNISKEKEKRKDIKRINNSKVNQNKINNRKNIINLDYSTGKINRKEKLNNEITNILGHCNIIKRKYIKSQSPEIKRVVTEDDKNKKKLIPKKSIVIDLTNFIEAKKANEIKSYRTKLSYYKANERHIKLINQSDRFHINFNYNEPFDHSEDKNLLTERNVIKTPKNLFLNKIIKSNNNNNINESSLYSFNNINNTSYIKNSNISKGEKIKTKINGYYFKEKAISPIINCKMKRINVNKKLNMYEEAKNGYILSSKKRKLSSNSFGKAIKSEIKNEKRWKELQITDSNNNIHNSKNHLLLKKDLTILMPRRQKTTYTIDCFKNFNSFINNSANNDIYKNKLNFIPINNKKSMVLGPIIIRRKQTDTGITNISFKRNYLLENNNNSYSNSNIRKIVLNKNKIKKEINSEDKNLNYIVRNNYIKEQIYSSYNKNQLPKKKYSYNFKNLNLMKNFRINKVY